MRYRTLGRTGMQVSTICLGTMMFGSWGNPDPAQCREVVDVALEAGVNFVDTADVYDRGRSEEILGEALAGRRDDVVLATKVFNAMGEDVNARGGSRRWIRRALEDSLRRLRTDRIDLYQLHRHDPLTDLDETLGALSDLVHEGKVLAIGSSTFPAEVIVEAAWVAEKRNRERLCTEQPPYSILARGIETSVLPTCSRFGLGVLVWSPLNGGFLTGKYRTGAAAPPGSRAVTNPDHFRFSGEAAKRKLDAVELLLPLAAEAGVPLAQLALAFTLAHPAVTSTIVGPRTPAQLRELVGAGEVELDEAVLRRIDEIVPRGVNLDPSDAG
jgi:aryl-alcohol dehydrogenase-like predicted oxidoreductase